MKIRKDALDKWEGPTSAAEDKEWNFLDKHKIAFSFLNSFNLFFWNKQLVQAWDSLARIFNSDKLLSDWKQKLLKENNTK